MQVPWTFITRNQAYYLLQECKDVHYTRRVQSLMVYNGFDSISVLGDHLIRLFTYQERLFEANQAFNAIHALTSHTWAAIIFSNAKLGQGRTALELHSRVQLSGSKSDKHIYVAVIKACTMTCSLPQGRIIHNQINKCELQLGVIVCSALLHMYATCKCLQEAWIVFENMHNRDVIAWNTMIAAYAEQGECHLALECFEKLQQEGIRPNVMSWNALISGCAQNGEDHFAVQCFVKMQQEGFKPNAITFLGILKVCARIEEGKLIHEHIIRSELNSDVMVASSIVHMYCMFGSLHEAFTIFDKVHNRDVVSWNAIIAGYAQHGEGQLALNCFYRMHLEDMHPNEVTFVMVFKACTSIAAKEEGRIIHGNIVRRGLRWNDAIGSSMIQMYATCGSLVEACNVFSQLSNQGVEMWNAMITSFAQHGESLLTLSYFEKIQQKGIKPDKATFANVLNSYGILRIPKEGRLIHEMILQRELQCDTIIGNTLVDMYAKCGHLNEACHVFYNMAIRDVVSWGAMIAGYIQHGEYILALECFDQMEDYGIQPSVVLWDGIISGYAHGKESHMALEWFQKLKDDGFRQSEVTFLSALKACSNMKAIEWGRFLHEQIIDAGLQSDVVVGSTLVDMYTKCCSLEEASTVFVFLPFKNVVSWTAMIMGYAQHGYGSLALRCFEQMQVECIKPNEFTYLGILKACGSEGDMTRGRLIHEQIKQAKLQGEVVLGNALIDMYIKSGSLQMASKAFDALEAQDEISWNAMIAGYTQCGEAPLAIEYFERMQEQGVYPDEITFLSVLKACANIGAVQQGRLTHDRVFLHGFPSVGLGNSLLDMYAKCGSLEEANKVFHQLPNNNIVSWCTMIAGYAQHGEILLATQCFDKMQYAGVIPTAMPFACVLIACSRVGLVNEGYWYFKSMLDCYGITPTVDHYGCMVDLLGRAGYLNEAENFLWTATMQNDVVGWTSLLSSCRMLGDTTVGKRCFEQVVYLDTHWTAGYVLMSNIYADSMKQGYSLSI